MPGVRRARSSGQAGHDRFARPRGHGEGRRHNRFCATAGCDVAWFGESTGHRIPVGASGVRIGQKETTADRKVCYCFGCSAADVEQQVAATGASTIPDLITEHCRNGEDRCPETNPQGACCLANVRALVGLNRPRVG